MIDTMYYVTTDWMDLYFSNFYELIELSNSYDYYFNWTSIGDIRDIREKRMKSELACMLYNFFIYFIYFFYFVFSLHMLCSLALLSCFIFKKNIQNYSLILWLIFLYSYYYYYKYVLYNSSRKSYISFFLLHFHQMWSSISYVNIEGGIVKCFIM